MKRKRKQINKHVLRENIAAYLFLLPWIIGLLLFVVYPFGYTIKMSFQQVTKEVVGWTYKGIGFENYNTAFFKNTEFMPLLIQFFSVQISYVPAILILSLVLSILLNTNIKFKSGFRLIYFFPVVVMSGPVLRQLGDSNATQIMDVSQLLMFRMVNNFSPFIGNMLESIFNNFTTILWFTGIPTVLFLNGLQRIDRQIYEAAEIDGANSWQMLWKISIPNLKSTALIVGIFTVVQISIFEINPIYNFIIDTINRNYNNGLGFASSVVVSFTFVVLILVLIVVLLLREKKEKIVTDTLRERQDKKIRQIRKDQVKKARSKETIKETLNRWFKKDNRRRLK